MRTVFKIFFLLSLLALMAGIATTVYGLWYFNRGLPEHEVLKNYSPPTVTRVHAGDGTMIAEYAEQRRVYVPIANIPDQVKNAFIAAEDKDFYHHHGVDPMAILRAIVQNIQRAIQGGRPIGASTITQQVAKNFLLSNELSIERKVREALLAIRIERTLSKDAILDLYLNEIYLGKGAYGVAAAALTYFDRSLGELSIAEAAFLAALPKAPNNYNPWRKNARAKERRDWIIGRMFALGYITQTQADDAIASPLEPQQASGADKMDARYFVEHIRRELAEDYGLNAVNRGGLSVRTTLDTGLQRAAHSALTKGLIAYDRRHGYRGATKKLVSVEGWPSQLQDLAHTPYPDPTWRRAVVLETHTNFARIGLEFDGTEGIIPLQGVQWARKYISDFKRGGKVKTVDQVLTVGDILAVTPISSHKDDTPNDTTTDANTQEVSEIETLIPDHPHYELQQIPNINGGIVALDPFTGRILAMQGGWNYAHSEFNRVTQAARQPGSAFKPFVYLAALEAGYTPSTRILDAPFVLDQGPNKPKWKPANYSKEFYGLSPMRIGIEKSRNLMTVRLAQQIGMPSIAEIAERFDLSKEFPHQLATSLGSHEITLLNITKGYAQIVNGGKSITPTAIDRVQDRYGKTVFLHDRRVCDDCDFQSSETLPILVNDAQQLASPEHLYQITSMLEGVVKRGTGKSIKRVGYPLAGKTGTTNDSFDTWFVGFSPNLAVGVFVGFDRPRSLGRHPAGYQETGSSVAAPIFRDFMAMALKDTTKIPFRVPENVHFIKIDPKTGLRAQSSRNTWIQEAFVKGTSPEDDQISITSQQNTTQRPDADVKSPSTSAQKIIGLY